MQQKKCKGMSKDQNNARASRPRTPGNRSLGSLNGAARRNCQKIVKGAELCQITDADFSEYWAEAAQPRVPY